MKVVVPIAISCFSLVVSAIALYFSQFTRAEIDVVAGEWINVYHFGEGNCGITLSISVANRGAQLATVRRFGLLINAANSKQGYLMEPIFYQKIDEKGDFLHDSQPVPVAIPGRSTETRQVLFRSSLEKPEEFQFTKAGTWQITVLAWIKDSVEPQGAAFFSLDVSDDDAETLKKRRNEKVTTTVRLRQSEWHKWGAHGLTEVEVAALSLRR